MPGGIRPMSPRQRDDRVLLAHLREQHRLSLQSYGRPRMTEELQALGLSAGHGRVGRLMRENGIKVIRAQKHHAIADGSNQKWAGDISYIWTSETRADLLQQMGHTSSGRRCDLPDINGFYNPSRRHSSHGCKSPLAFKRSVA